MTMKMTFKTNGGKQVVEVTDPKMMMFFDITKNIKDEFGCKPNHPLDYLEIVNQLYYEEKIDVDALVYYEDELMKIWKSFNYNEE